MTRAVSCGIMFKMYEKKEWQQTRAEVDTLITSDLFSTSPAGSRCHGCQQGQKTLIKLCPEPRLVVVRTPGSCSSLPRPRCSDCFNLDTAPQFRDGATLGGVACCRGKWCPRKIIPHGLLLRLSCADRVSPSPCAPCLWSEITTQRRLKTEETQIYQKQIVRGRVWCSEEEVELGQPVVTRDIDPLIPRCWCYTAQHILHQCS